MFINLILFHKKLKCNEKSRNIKKFNINWILMIIQKLLRQNPLNISCNLRCFDFKRSGKTNQNYFRK